MAGFEWWTGSFGQWLFIAMSVTPCIAAAVLTYLVKR